jgi:general secretion pathway protein D
MAANQASNSLIYTDTQANIRRVLKIINSLDGQMGSEATVKVYKLEYADATSTAKLITDLFKQDETSQQSGRGFPFMFGGPGGDRERGRGEGGGSSGGATGRQSKVTATADTRTNNLVVSASPETLTLIDGIVKELDSDRNADVAVFIYKLKNAQAVNVESVVNNIFGTTGTTSRGGSSYGTSSFGRGSTSGGTSPFGGSSSSGRGSSSGSPFGSSSGSPFGSSSGSPFGSSSGSGFGSSSGSPFGSSSRGFGSSGTSSSGRSSYGSTPSIGPLGAAAGDLAGQVYVVADPDTNSLLVRTASKNFDRVKAILEELDRPTRQVLIKVLLAEVTHDNTTDLGVEFSALNIRIGSSKSTIGTDFPIDTVGVAATDGGLIAKVVDVDYTATLRALQTVGKLNVLSRPYILASDNQQASIMVGNLVPFITNSRITEDSATTINTIQYEDIGIILYVIPHINPEGLVIMDVAPEISALTSAPGLLGPVFAKRSAQTRVAIRNGQTIVIGGLMEDRITDKIVKVPGLGDIPGIGVLFQRTVKTKSKTELLIFITPHVAALPEQLQKMAKEEKEGGKEFNKDENKEALDEQLKGMMLGATSMPADPTTDQTIIILDQKKNPAKAPTKAPGLAPASAPAGGPDAPE